MQASMGESLAHQQGHHAKQHHVDKVRRAELVGHLFKRDAILYPADKQRGSGLPLPMATGGNAARHRSARKHSKGPYSQSIFSRKLMDGLPRKRKFATKRHICKRHTTNLSCSVKQTNISPDLALLS